MSDKLDKKNYTIAELIQDSSFRRMVKGTATTEEIDRWSHWMETSDENRQKAREAASEIAGFGFDLQDQEDIEKEWSRLYKNTLGKERKKGKANKINSRRRLPLKWIYRIAAVLILGTFVGFGAYIHSTTDQITTGVEQITQERTIETGADEQTTVKFSNGSKVILNSNSAITYNIDLLHRQTIKVVLEGEAYFDAEGDPAQKQPVFAVHTPDGVIRDIGTEFLVAVKGDRSSVVLQEGRVEISANDRKNGNEKIALSEGEILEFDESNVLSRKSVNATFYTAWATGSMEFDRTTIKEFAGFVEQRFDVTVRIASPEIASIALDGAVYFESLAGLVRSVSDVTKVPVYQSKDQKTVYIGNMASTTNQR